MNCNCIYRITAILKVETNVIANISASPIVRARIFVMMSVKAFKTDVIVFISDAMCFTSDWPINLCTRVKNWPNIFVDQSQFSDSDFINGIHQRENVQFTDKETFFCNGSIILYLQCYIPHIWEYYCKSDNYWCGLGTIQLQKYIWQFKFIAYWFPLEIHFCIRNPLYKQM